MSVIRAARPDSLPPATDKLVVVEASAGTGKTYFLEHRVVDLILAGAELPQILLVTFTDKAVAELRLRIRDLLDRLSRLTADTAAAGAPAWDIDDAARAKLRAAVTAFDHASIFTIHAFCHRVLVEDAFAARRLFEQTQVADEAAFDDAFDALLREQFARDVADRELLRAYLETGKGVEDLRNLLLRCARTGARPRATFEHEAVLELGAKLRAVLGTEEQRKLVVLKGTSAKNRDNWLATAAAAMPKLASTSAATVLAGIDELREDAAKLRSHLKLPIPPGLADALDGVAKTLALTEAIAAAFLPRILERVARDKAEHGHFDYDDMLQLVHRALRDERGDELAARLRTRTPWVMIDEFQDTDPTQWDIFRNVWMHDAARGLAIVGDPKQAIYGFRGADVDTYLAARDEMLRNGATHVTLSTNRRSTAELVEATNLLLLGPPEARAFASPLLQGAITYDPPVSPCGDITSTGGAPITIFALAAPTGFATSEANRTALAGAICDEVERLRTAPPSWRDRSGDRTFALGQVMVLTRTNVESADIAKALRARGLPCALVEGDKLFETREAAELAAVLTAIASPRDRSARLRALRTRYFDVPWSDLMKVVDAPDHHPLIARLYDWAALAARRQYESLFRRLVEDSRFAERALVLGGGERALTNTWHLLELLLDEVAVSRSDLHELVRQLRRWIADRSDRFDDRDTQRAETDADAIRVLTVHKAKGLEAPYVFFYGGISAPPNHGKIHTLREANERLLFVHAQEPAVLDRIDAETDAENMRLAYVALTRAQLRLYLPHYALREVTDRAVYHPIQRCVKSHALAKGADARLFRTIDVTTGAEEAEPAPPTALQGFVASALPPISELAAITGTRGGLSTLSYTRLAHDLAAQVQPPRTGEAPLAIEASEFDVDDATGQVAPDELPPGAASGLLLHDVLEHVDLAHARAATDFDTWRADPALQDILHRAARDRGVGEQYLPHAERVVHRTLTAPLTLVEGGELPALIAAPRIAREVEFNFALQDRRGLVRGFIDALVAWDDDLWVLDYKSDVLVGEDLGAAARARANERYGVQARLYAIAADRLRGTRRLAGMLFAFVRYGLVVPIRCTPDTIASWTTWLEALEPAEATP